MELQQVKIGNVVRHRHILRGTDLFVFGIQGETVSVRYGIQGVFHTQELHLMEVESFAPDADEYD